LAGDSCHTTPPFLGQGLNQGMKDSANLAWKIKAVLNGQADEHVLVSYQQEREKVVREVVGGAVTMGRVSEEFKAAQREGPEALRATVQKVRDEKRGFESGFSMGATKMLHCDLDKRLPTLLRNDRITGQTVPNPDVMCADGVSRSLDAVIDGWHVVLLCVSEGGDAPALSAAAQAAVGRCGVQVVRLASAAAQGDCEHRVKLAASHEFVRHGPCAIIIRPDKFVYGMTKLSDVSDLIMQFEQYLKPTSTSRL